MWFGIDPLAEKMPDWSSYAYAFNNPIRYSDPTGMYPEESGGGDPIYLAQEITANSEQGGDPPRIGEVRNNKCGAMEYEIFNGEEWVASSRIPITGTGQINATDSPIEWLLGAWKMPFQAADDIGALGISAMRVPKGEMWVDAASGAMQKAGTFVKEGKTYLKFLTDKVKTNFSKTNSSRGVPKNFPTPNPQPKSKYGPILDLIFGNFNPPK